MGLLLQLATLPAHPESVPINRLVAVKGTPLQVRGKGVCVEGGGGGGGEGIGGRVKREREGATLHSCR